MASRRRESLKPHLAKIRIWVEEGRTDFWIAHELGASPQSVATFRRSHGVYRVPREAPPDLVPVALDVVDDDEAVEDDEAQPVGVTTAAEDDADEAGARRRRGRRGGRRRRGADPVELEAVFDHGEEGYGLWLDAAIQDAEVYRRHWEGVRSLIVRIEADEIVIRRAAPDPDPEPDDD